MEDRIKAQIKRWQERLLDLSKANPLLGINRSRVSRLRAIEPDPKVIFHKLVIKECSLRMPLVEKVQPTTYTDANNEENTEPRYNVIPGDIAFEAEPPDLQRRLRRIYDNARTSVVERGVTTLHLSFGVLQWEDPQLGESVSPLWLVPCKLESFGPIKPMKLSTADEEMQVNPALELYLRERYHLELPALPEDPDTNALAAFFNDLSQRTRDYGWAVRPEVWLSTYSFESLVIYQDLKAMGDKALQNRIVIAFSQVDIPTNPAGERSKPLEEEEIDDAPTPERVPIPVLEADSSQLKALTLAHEGRNLVVHGPPGTGKSQTIANLTANALGEGKKVLFVSAKMAALEVVYHRLDQLGLGRFCLEAHSTKAGKAKIIEELRRTLADAEKDPANYRDDYLEKWCREKKQLNAYIRSLHEQRHPLGLSPYEAISKAEKLHRVPDVQCPLPWSGVLAVTPQRIDEALDVLRDLGSQWKVFDHRSSHPWRGFAVEPGKVPSLDQVRTDLEEIQSSLQIVAGHLSRLQTLIGPTDSLTYEGLHRLVATLNDLSELTRLPDRWSVRESSDLEEVAALLDEAASRAEEEALKIGEHEKVWKIPPAKVVQLLEPAETEFSSFLRRLRPAYWRWLRIVRKDLCPGAPSRFGTLYNSLTRGRRLLEIQSWFELHSGRIAAEVGTEKVRDVSRLREAEREVQVALKLKAGLISEKIVPPKEPVPLSDDHRNATRKIVKFLKGDDWQKSRESMDRVDVAWPRGFARHKTMVRATPMSDILDRCGEILNAMSRSHEWIVLQNTLHRCRQIGLGDFVGSLGSVSAKHAADAFAKRFYRAWAEAALQTSENLALFTGSHREERIQRFRQIDTELRKSWLTRIKAVASNPAHLVATEPQIFAKSVSKNDKELTRAILSEVKTLRRELQKRHRFKPLRKLFEEIPRVLQALKPCMLMSPLSVSTFLPRNLTFDLVIFDEASQLPTPEAIPSILRAKQVVVAGDSKQLPPTAFFKASGIWNEGNSEDDSFDDQEPLESLLDDCIANVPLFNEAHLRWHYRSRDERLITFSNHYFYQEKPLITFPSPTTGEEDQGVRLVYVENGVWERGGSRTNIVEARRVIDLIIEHIEKRPQRSLGVVAMNMAQRELIEELLDDCFLNRPDLREILLANTEEPFFVKALENVQGDERDTIIISVGYGKTASGALNYNFGPLNQEGGWRRLNVLVTRARWQTILVTSMRAQDLAGVNPNNRGAVALRNFIEYAERGGQIPPETPVPTGAETNDFEDAVAEALRERGYQVDPQVGASGYRIDLAIRDPYNPKQYLIGIECDGATYHSAKTARDRDILREEVLKSLGWRLYRIWSTDWFRNREQTLSATVRAIESAKMEQYPESPVIAPSPSARRYAPGVPYKKYNPKGSQILLLDPLWQEDLASQVVQIVKVEGPIHQALLTERLKEVNGIEGVEHNVEVNIQRAIQLALERKELELDGTHFLRCPGQKLATFRIPNEGIQRPPAWIPIEEIQLAVLAIVEEQSGSQESALLKAVAKLFGYHHTSPELTERVVTAVNTLIDEKRLQRSGPNVYLV